MIIHHRRMCSSRALSFTVFDTVSPNENRSSRGRSPSSGQRKIRGVSEGFLELTVHEVGCRSGWWTSRCPNARCTTSKVIGRAVEGGGEGSAAARAASVPFDPGLPQPVGEPVGNLPLAESAVPVRQEQGFHFPGGHVDGARPGNGAAMCGGRS